MKTLIVVPCMDMVHTAFFASYNSMRKVGETGLSVCQNSLVYDSRNLLGKAALDSGADRILWLDSDMMLPVNLMELLSADLDAGCECVSALYFRRSAPYGPVIFDTVERNEVNGRLTVDATTFKTWPRDQVFEVAGFGFGAVMMTTALYRRVYEQYGLPFSPLLGFSEDISFCWRARQLGATLYCDSRVMPKHMGMMAYDGRLFETQKGS